MIDTLEKENKCINPWGIPHPVRVELQKRGWKMGGVSQRKLDYMEKIRQARMAAMAKAAAGAVAMPAGTADLGTKQTRAETGWQSIIGKLPEQTVGIEPWLQTPMIAPRRPLLCAPGVEPDEAQEVAPKPRPFDKRVLEQIVSTVSK